MPHQRGGARVDASGIEPDTHHDVVAARRREQHGLRSAGTVEPGCAISEVELGGAGVKTHEDCVELEAECVGETVAAAWQIDDALSVNKVLKCGGIVGRAVPSSTIRECIGPSGR